MTVEQRNATVREKKLCFTCMRAGHITKNCKSFVRCSICGGRHYEMLCKGRPAEVRQQQPQFGEPGRSHSMMNTDFPQPQFYNQQQGFIPKQEVGQGYATPFPAVNTSVADNRYQYLEPLNTNYKPPEPRTGMSNMTMENVRTTLYTLLARLVTADGGTTIVRVFIDDGSDDSYITNNLAEVAGCKQIGSRKLTHQLFGGRFTQPVDHNRFEVTLKALEGNGEITANFNATDKIAHRLRKPPTGEWREKLEQLGVSIADQSNATDGVQVLIGLDIMAQILTGGFVRINKYFVAQETVLGWVVGGKQPDEEPEKVTNSHMVTSMMINQLNPEDLWGLEILGIVDEPASQTKKELEAGAWDHFKKTVKQLPDGRYEVEFPWVQDHQEIKNNYGQAVAQLHKQTKDLLDQNHFESYNLIFTQWEENGIIEDVPDQSSLSTGYYMPHRHVIKTNSATTPLRPVFNASAKAKNSVSLNDCLVVGPNMLELIPAIMMRFRRYQVGVVADVEKAFLQMSIAPRDRDFVRFLWWTDNTCKKLRILRHKRVVFGVRPSPFLLAATLKFHLEKHGQQQPNITEMLINSLYVDNSVTSHATIEDANEFERISQELLLSAKFNLRGWEYGPSLEEKIVPVLGMNWNTKEDNLSLCLENTLKKINGAPSKRGLLSLVNSIFDPLGIVCPVTLIPKLLFQQCCTLKLTWDETLPEEIAEKLEQWKRQIPDLKNLRIPRWMANCNENNISIHIFSDGSSAAYATSIFLRSECNGQVNVQLIMAKSRVVPKDKKMTIPRIELMGCLIAVRLTREVKIALSLTEIDEWYWTDSTTALAWIQHEKQWARFVQGRVTEIRKHTKAEMWRHVPGEINPADLPSRGCTVSKFLEMKWWEGPQWLHLPSTAWPISHPVSNEEEVRKELKKVVVSMANVKEEDSMILQLLAYSDFNKAVLVIAAVQYYIQRLKIRVRARKAGLSLDLRQYDFPIFTSQQVEMAEKVILKIVQQCSFTGEEDKRIRKLGAFQDQEGLIRIKTQLLFGNDEYNVRCPIVLPNDHEMIRLLIRKEHECNSHAGVQTLQAILRERYWILKSRRTISSVIRNCVRCRMFLAKRCEVPASHLPIHRIQDTYAFNVVGVDLAGPLFLRGGDRVWIVLFTDAVFRGIHLELVSTLSTEGFISCFRRFVSRRGRPSYVYSDNGLNFVGCNNLFTQINWTEVNRYAAVEKIRWRFNPPTAAWWGGFWERMVGLVKTLLRRILGKQVVNYDQLHTILCDVEATVNRRPLTFVSDSDGTLQPLCPVHFMRDNPGTELPEADVVDTFTMKKALVACQKLREQLRVRFRREYLAQLQHQAGIRNITVKPGDVVLIEVDDKKRLDWPWGVVKEIYPGRDGHIRTALVKTRNGSFLRPVQRLFVLETSQKDQPVKIDTVKEETVETPNKDTKLVTRCGREVKKPDYFKF